MPYDRGDLVSRIHENGEVLASEHVADGTRLTARVTPDLAGDLTAYRRPLTLRSGRDARLAADGCTGRPSRAAAAGTLRTVQKAPREITTNRLTLRPPTGGTGRCGCGLHRDPALYEHAPWRDARERRRGGAGFTDCLDRWESAGFDYGVVEETNTRAGIGVGGLRRRQLDEHGEQVLNLYYRLAARGARPGPRDGGGAGLDRPRPGVAARPARRPEVPRDQRRVGADGPRGRAGARRHRRRRPGRAAALHGAAGAAGRVARLVRRGRPASRCSTCGARSTTPGERWGSCPARRATRSRGALAAHEEGMADGGTTGVLLRGADRRVVGAGFWVADRNPLLGHARTAYRIMTAPGPARAATWAGCSWRRCTGSRASRTSRSPCSTCAAGWARRGSTRAAATSRSAGCPASSGWRPGDDRDSVVMARRLDGQPMVADGRA